MSEDVILRCATSVICRLLGIPQERKTALLMEHFTAYYWQLTRSEPVQCANSGKIFSGIMKPDAVIADVGSVSRCFHCPLS
jgi:hypothetical protein